MSEIKNRILDRLETEDIPQLVGHLRDEDGCMCAQGVIVDEYLRAHGRDWEYTTGGFGIVESDEGANPFNGVTAWTPGHIQNWSGFSDAELVVMATRNDAGWDLPRISRLVRAGIDTELYGED